MKNIDWLGLWFLILVGCGDGLGVPGEKASRSPTCTDQLTEAACNAISGCYSTYREDATAIVPTMVFAACASGMPTCDQASGGVCLSKHVACGAYYSFIYEGSCAVGCVKVALCPTSHVARPPFVCEGLDEADCNAAAGCRAVYTDRGARDCNTPGCVGFNRCAEGAASCLGGEVLCDRSPPVCGPSYVVSYESSCYEGCVKPQSCAK